MNIAQKWSGQVGNATLIAALCGVILLAVSTAFVWHDGLASFADDSVSYLVMARYYSPYHALAPAIAYSYTYETNYPPIFPLLLALVDGSHSYPIAHLVVAVCFTTAWMVYYFHLRLNTGSYWLALSVALLFATMPVVWTNLMGILSESLYLLLALVSIYIFDRQQTAPKNEHRYLATQALLLTLAVLTRNVGIALVGAYVIATFLGAQPGKRLALRRYLPALVAIIAVIMWPAIRPSGFEGLYSDILGDILSKIGATESGSGNLLSSIQPQIAALYPAWASSFLIYWTDDWTLRDGVVLLMAAGTFAGLVMRLLRNKIDAWYLLLYLIIVLVWPTSNQMQRFLYPVIPFLLLQLIDAVVYLFGKASSFFRPTAVVAIPVFVMVTVTFPALLFIYHRATFASDLPYNQISEFYRVPDLGAAKKKARRHIELFHDMESIRKATRPEDVVIWYEPGYLALLADRKGAAMPPVGDAGKFFTYIRESGAKYVFLSTLHPRYTVNSNILNEWLKYFKGFTSTVWYRGDNEEKPDSILLAVDHNALESRYNAVTASQNLSSVEIHE